MSQPDEAAPEEAPCRPPREAWPLARVLGLVLMKMGRAGPPFEPRRRPQAGKSRDPRSQNADSSPRAQGAPGLGRAERRKGKGEAPRALTACGLGRRMAVGRTGVLQQPRRLIKERHLPRLSFFAFSDCCSDPLSCASPLFIQISRS